MIFYFVLACESWLVTMFLDLLYALYGIVSASLIFSSSLSNICFSAAYMRSRPTIFCTIYTENIPSLILDLANTFLLIFESYYGRAKIK